MKYYTYAFSLLIVLLFARNLSAVAGETSTDEVAPPCHIEWTGRRVVFLGDSITHDGTYIAYLETALLLSDPEAEVDFLNLGLSSETVSGLSEPAHPFPRPDLHERLDRVLEKAKPDTPGKMLVVACYGINDGIYYPFSEERFAAYQKGVNRLIEKCDAAKVELVLLTPLPFDPLPGRKAGTLLPAGEKEYSWKEVYEEYDQVMQKYAEWLVELREPVTTGQLKRPACVVDLRKPMNDYLQSYRKEAPDFAISTDGVHINVEGHQQVASALVASTGVQLGNDPRVKALRLGNAQAPSGVSRRVKEEAAEILEIVKRRQDLLRDAWLSHIGHKRPGVKPGMDLRVAQAMADDLLKMIKLQL